MRALLLMIALAMPAHAQSVDPREGWVVMDSDKPYAQLVKDVRAAAKANGMGVVTQAGPTGAAKSRGITIPGNRVIGIFNNVYAVRILGLSTAAMIEAPIRIYVTEEPDGSGFLSYKTPSYVFAPYMDEGGADLAAAAGELDGVFEAILQMAY
ncbi:hypothetical protein ACMU_06140 [Actibacterium mucosum KCTC 23349]|uniref:DUF302 domain-containing protein n=1 Tax=Actibacterium mucosum KCTC 23349 TaxID=1454373 RepID=A0A037ZLK2_9RHOB|nr:DUF302 domain-containing protein [Actibacterium mucosum]KAJ56519.1 hypothetical protein ACMU_06140 [Actibacterium mucosum KCTC 23349]